MQIGIITTYVFLANNGFKGISYRYAAEIADTIQTATGKLILPSR